MRGAIIFIVVFAVFLAATLAYPEMPSGHQIYNALGLPTTDYLVLGIQATTFIIAVFNGVIYGVIVWLIYSIAERATKRKQ